MKCTACNKTLNEGELYQYKSDGAPEDMCNTCKPKCYEEFGIFDKVYEHEHIQSGLCQPRNSSY